VKRKTAKELLAESFRELAQERDIDRITVQDIAKNCGYSIATFYRQFRDKYDLIAWDYARDVQKLLEQEDGTNGIEITKMAWEKTNATASIGDR